MFEKYFKAYRPFILIMMILLSAIGYYCFSTMSKEAIPEVNLPFFNITAVYPGADSETIEQQVIKKIEDKLPSVNNIATFSSISSNNVGVINLEFKRGTDKWMAYADLKSAVDEVKSSLPSWVKDVIVTKTDPKDIPAYSFSVTGPYYPSNLYDKVKDIEDDLKKISGVDKIFVIGKYVSQVEVEFDYEKLKKYNLRLPVLVGLIGQNMTQTPIDKKKLDGNLYSFEVRTYDKSGSTLDEKLTNFKSFLENLPLINQSWNTLRLKDLAKVNVTHPYYQRLSYVNGVNAVTFMVYKVPWTDILKVIDSVKSYLATRDTEFAKENISYKEMFSQEIMINETFDAFLSGFRDTSIFIVIIATIFLWLRGSIAVLITFPFVYLLTFIVLKYYGYTFNSIVSVALNLSLWIMVDNLIVIAQWFQSGLKKDMGKFEAIAYSLKIYWKSLFIGNLVTISMFFPLGFMLTGKIGEFLKFLPVTVNLTLIFSILVAFLFLPLILSYTNFDEKKNSLNVWHTLEHFFSKFEKNFDAFYKKILRNPKYPMIFFYCLFALVILAFSKFGTLDFMPLTDKDNIFVNIKYNKNISISENQKMTSKIYGFVDEFFKKNHTWVVKNIELSIGELSTQSPLDNTIYRTSFNPELTKLNLVLTNSKERKKNDNAVIILPELRKYLNEKLSAAPEIKNKINDLTVFVQKNGPSEGKDVTFNLLATGVPTSEMKVLASEYEKILPELKKIPWTYGWGSSLEYTNGKVKIIYDLDKLSQLGISGQELDMFLYWLNQKSEEADYLTDYKWNGLPLGNLNDFGKDVIPVKWFVNYDYAKGQTINFKDLMIPWTNVYVSDVIKEIKMESQIKSVQHLEGNLVLKVEGNKDPSLALWDVTSKVNEIVAKSSKIELVYGADVKDMTQSWADMWISFVVWFILMFAILVFNFQNFKQPIILMSTMPLFLTGALFFLLVSGECISMIVGIWFFGLIGVWLAHIIYLINRFNELLEDSEGIRDLDGIILASVKSRLEPIFLTTTITSLGLLVLSYSDDLWRAFALSFAGGLLLGTTITLIFIPSALKVAYRKVKIKVAPITRFRRDEE